MASPIKYFQNVFVGLLQGLDCFTKIFYSLLFLFIFYFKYLKSKKKKKFIVKIQKKKNSIVPPVFKQHPQ